MKEGFLDQIQIVKDIESGNYICSAEIKGEHFEAVYRDILMATAWAENIADYSMSK